MKPTRNRRLATPIEPAPAPAEPRRRGRAAKNVERSVAPPPPVSPAPPVDPERAARRRQRLARIALHALDALRIGLGLVLALGVAGGLAWSARNYALTSPRFAVATIDVQGNRRLPEEHVTQLAGLDLGMNVFSVHPEEARQRLREDAWVASAEVSRKLPGSVSIQIVEHEAAALVALGETMLATREGLVFKRLEEGDPVELPVVTCLDADRLAADPEGVRRTVVAALDLLAEYENSRLSKRYSVQELCAKNDGSFSLVVGREGVTLRLGAPPYRRKLAQADRVLFEVERRRAKADVVMVDNEARPDRVVVRVR